MHMRTNTYWIAAIVMAACAAAQGQNLLTNGDFEAYGTKATGEQPLDDWPELVSVNFDTQYNNDTHDTGMPVEGDNYGSLPGFVADSLVYDVFARQEVATGPGNFVMSGHLSGGLDGSDPNAFEVYLLVREGFPSFALLDEFTLTNLPAGGTGPTAFNLPVTVTTSNTLVEFGWRGQKDGADPFVTVTAHVDDLSLTVNNTAPIVDAGPNQLKFEGETVSLAPATFTDGDAGDTHTATIDWGDGTVEPGVVDQDVHTVSGSHVYADDGDYDVIVTVLDDAGGGGGSVLTVTVSNVAPAVNAGPDRVVLVNEEVQLASEEFLYNGFVIPAVLDAATFADMGFDNPQAPSVESFTAAVNWGDGSPVATDGAGLTINWTNGSAGVPTSGTVTGSHMYTAPGVYTLSVTVDDDDTGSAQDTSQITVLNSTDCNENGTPDDSEDLSIVYVDASATGAEDGTSWTDAFVNVQQALDVATCSVNQVQEIWVAEGTYMPDGGYIPASGPNAGVHTAGDADRNATFQLISGVEIYGGFPTGGGDGTFNARDVETYEAILSGDLADDDDDSPPACGSCIAGPVTNPANGHFYYLLPNANWTDSEATAVSLGGHLVTINNAAENQWVLDTFSQYGGPDRSLWLGFTDQAQEGSFIWSSGEPVTYTNWRAGEPNNAGGENWAQMQPPADTCGPGEWNDLTDSLTYTGCSGTWPNHGVVEVDPLQNAYHVVTGSGVDATAVLNGFTITAGNATGAGDDENGGGMFNRNASLIVRNCRFEGNRTHLVGGGRGGAVYNEGDGPRFEGCVFDNNAAQNGGAMRNNTSNVVLEDCVFTGNFGDDAAGALQNQSGSQVIAERCAFRNNYVTVASFGGGASTVENNSDVDFIDCVFEGNHSPGTGGAVRIDGGSASFINSTFVGNTASGDGGAIYHVSNDLDVTNCAFSGNVAGVSVGAIFRAGGSIDVVNTVIWINSDANGMSVDSQISGSSTVTYSNVQGGFAGTGNIDADPLFVRDPDPGANGWDGVDDDYGDLHLQPGSPCIDAADNTAPDLAGVTTDLDGNNRFVDDPATADTGNGTPPIVDMGPYEFGTYTTAWRSVRTHTGAGEQGIALDAAAVGSGASSEPRKGGVQKIEVDLTAILLPSLLGTAGAEDLTGGGTILATSQNLIDNGGGSYTLVLEWAPGLPDLACYRIDLAGAVDNLAGDTDCIVRVLEGDMAGAAGGDGLTNLIDAAEIKQRNGLTVAGDPSLARYDDNLDGNVNLIDYAEVKQRNGTGTTCP